MKHRTKCWWPYRYVSSRSVKSCQVRVVNNTSVPAQEGSSSSKGQLSSSSTSSDNGGIKTEAEDDDDQEIDTKKSVVKSAHSSINHNSKATATNGDSKTKMTGMFSLPFHTIKIRQRWQFSSTSLLITLALPILYDFNSAFKIFYRL